MNLSLFLNNFTSLFVNQSIQIDHIRKKKKKCIMKKIKQYKGHKKLEMLCEHENL